MTTRREPRHEQAERIRDLIREHEERRAQRDRASFEEAVADLLHRVSTRPPPPAPALQPPTPTRGASDDPSQVWWSHTPVLGYRVWELKQGRLHGAWTPWKAARKTAACLDTHSSARGPVPHDASECRPPPCGIYALKGTRRVQQIVERSIRQTPVPITLAIGLVAMTGRVVEHESGYRAQHVEVLALAFVTGAVGKHSVLAMVPDRAAVARAFVDPRLAKSRIVPEAFTPVEAVSRAARFLEERELVFAS